MGLYLLGGAFGETPFIALQFRETEEEMRRPRGPRLLVLGGHYIPSKRECKKFHNLSGLTSEAESDSLGLPRGLMSV